jgi:hypothetical protein
VVGNCFSNSLIYSMEIPPNERPARFERAGLSAQQTKGAPQCCCFPKSPSLSLGSSWKSCSGSCSASGPSEPYAEHTNPWRVRSREFAKVHSIRTKSGKWARDCGFRALMRIDLAGKCFPRYHQASPLLMRGRPRCPSLRGTGPLSCPDAQQALPAHPGGPAGGPAVKRESEEDGSR